MQTNDWENRLADQVNNISERTALAVKNGNRNEDTRRKLTVQFLDDIAGLLQESIKRFNEKASSKIEFISKSRDQRGDTFCGFKYLKNQIRFVDSGRGFIRVDLAQTSSVEEIAFILARLSRSGSFITWDEKNLMGFGNRLEPVTLTHIVRKYITFLVTR